MSGIAETKFHTSQFTPHTESVAATNAQTLKRELVADKQEQMMLSQKQKEAEVKADAILKKAISMKLFIWRSSIVLQNLLFTVVPWTCVIRFFYSTLIAPITYLPFAVVIAINAVAIIASISLSVVAALEFNRSKKDFSVNCWTILLDEHEAHIKFFTDSEYSQQVQYFKDAVVYSGRAINHMETWENPYTDAERFLVEHTIHLLPECQRKLVLCDWSMFSECYPYNFGLYYKIHQETGKILGKN